ncbi:MAG: UbiA prenyltransferase family protein [Kiritimatiellia bacterium]|jgi:4-hydroxybenzoate polyprenyltransferase
MNQLFPYIRLLRPDNWFKNIFMLPGILLAVYFRPDLLNWATVGYIAFGLGAACLIASSNYVFNEILDVESDRHHPVKHNRPLVEGAARVSMAWALWIVISLAGVTAGFALNFRFGMVGLLFWAAGILYNLPPIRLKDIPYCDVLSESLNNPLRLALGWYATGLGFAPPLSMFMAYWMFGAFLMAAKRFAEFRMIGDVRQASRYRKSFARYTEESLIESIFFYATLFALMSGYFIARYRFELVLAAPLVALAMAYYLHLAYKPSSTAQYPELLYREKKLILLVLAAFLACTALLFIDLPAFDRLFNPWLLPPVPAIR